MVANVKSLVVVAGIFVVNEPYVTCGVGSTEVGPGDLDKPGHAATDVQSSLLLCWPRSKLASPNLFSSILQLFPSVCPSAHLPSPTPAVPLTELVPGALPM